MQWLKHIPRPDLHWMSEPDIKRVRDSIIKVYLAPGEGIRVAPPYGSEFFGISQLILYGGPFPCFTWNVDGRQINAWLKVVSGKKPYWDLRIDDGEVRPVKFKDPMVRVAAKLIKAYEHYFPYLPTENYLQNNGNFVA